MKKTILAYILSCIEEIPNDFDLGAEIRQLHETLLTESDKSEDILINLLLAYTILYGNDYQLGSEVRKLYNEINYFFDECKTGTHTDSN